MSRFCYTLPAVEYAIREVYYELDSRITVSWRKHSEDNLWKELVFCILGSRVRFETVHKAVTRMDLMCLLSRPKSDAKFDLYEQNTALALSEVYPFFRVKANQIRRSAEHIYGKRGSIRQLLNSAGDVCIVRRLLINEVFGLGPKQASLYLRNIGFTSRLAVLDVHILTYLSWVGLAEPSIKSVSTLKKYEALEESFIQHSYHLGCSPAQFDLAVWIVMKVAKEESSKWGS